MPESLTVTAPIASNANPTLAPETPARPEGLPEKFKTWEDLKTAYTELEKKLGTQTPTPTPTTPQTQPPPITPTPVDPTKPVQFDMSKYETEFSSTGQLSPESYAELSSRGFDKNIVDNYIAGKQAQIQQQKAALLEPVGGEAGYTAMTQWAAQNLSPQEVEAYNKAVASPDQAVVANAIAGLHARHTLSVGQTPSLVSGTASANSGPAPFRSWAEVTAAMSDPRYKNDPAYQSDVMQRMAKTQL